MAEYIVNIEKNGRQVVVGKLAGTDSGNMRFSYFPEYIAEESSSPVSVSLPLQTEPFSSEATKCFFDGLLPEGFTRRTVAQHMHLSEDDYISILYGLGNECLGALRITNGSESEHASYEKLSLAQVKELAAEGASRSAEMVTRARLSLAGASGKVGLYYDAEENSWYLPHGTAPSTHIVKQSHVRYSGIVVNEQLALMTAEKCGIVVPRSFIINTGEGRDQDVLLATKRYDRVFADASAVVKTIDSLPIPFRLHQEDLAQAMGIPAAYKYERPGEKYLAAAFDLLRRYSSDPIADQLRLWDIIVFNWLIGNTDAHLKNYSLIYSADMHSRRLAPAYDLVSTTAYSGSTREMSFNIGGDTSIDVITRGSFKKAAQDANLGQRMALDRFDRLCERFTASLDTSTQELCAIGFNSADRLRSRILETGGIRNVM